MATYKNNSECWDDWMKSALTGDKESYRKLLNDLHPWLVSFFSKRLNINIAEDLAQEALLSLHKNRHTYDPDQAFGPWISAIARYRMIDYLRKVQRSPESEFDELFQAPQDEHGSAVTSKVDLERLMGVINREQAQVIDLVKLQQYSIKEAAEMTGHSESSVKVMIHRGLKKMAAQLSKAKGMWLL